MSYCTYKHDTRFEPRSGLEGPFHYPNGQVLYYDPKAGQYYDPTTDFYVDNSTVAFLQQSILDAISR
jgi:beta-lactam-binding protein with PASTA domain